MMDRMVLGFSVGLFQRRGSHLGRDATGHWTGLGEALEFCGALQSIHRDLGGSTAHAREAGWMSEPVGTCWNLLGMQKDLKIMRLRGS